MEKNYRLRLLSVQAAAMALNRINSAFAPSVIEGLQMVSSSDKRCRNREFLNFFLEGKKECMRLQPGRLCQNLYKNWIIKLPRPHKKEMR